MKNNERRTKMKLKAKVAILAAAVFLTFVGFNLIATTSAVDLVTVGSEAGYEIITNYLTKAGAGSHYSGLIGA